MHREAFKKTKYYDNSALFVILPIKHNIMTSFLILCCSFFCCINFFCLLDPDHTVQPPLPMCIIEPWLPMTHGVIRSRVVFGILEHVNKNIWGIFCHRLITHSIISFKTLKKSKNCSKMALIRNTYNNLI